MTVGALIALVFDAVEPLPVDRDLAASWAAVAKVSYAAKASASTILSVPLDELYPDSSDIQAEYEDQRTIASARTRCHEVHCGQRMITADQADAILAILGAK